MPVTARIPVAGTEGECDNMAEDERWESIHVTPEDVARMLEEREGGRRAGRGDSPFTQEKYEEIYGMGGEEDDGSDARMVRVRRMGLLRPVLPRVQGPQKGYPSGDRGAVREGTEGTQEAQGRDLKDPYFGKITPWYSLCVVTI